MLAVVLRDVDRLELKDIHQAVEVMGPPHRNKVMIHP